MSFMKWIKKGLVFKAENNYPWMVSHASIPFVDTAENGIWRIYFGTRDAKGISHVARIDVQAKAPKNILKIYEKEVIPLGKLGTFDDNGIMPSWIVTKNGRKYLYYIGWNPQVTVSYRLSIGLAISDDNGETYYKYSEGPICDRSMDEPYFNTAPCVIVDNGVWRMWYVSCTEWRIINNWPEPFYHIKYAESKDGVHWIKTGRICIDYENFTQAIGRPCVFIQDGLYKMIYSYRSAFGYREEPKQSYRLGYAESKDGIVWIRKDDEVGIACSENGWDSEMMEYAHIFCHSVEWHMFYNGNGFGKSGVGYAVLASN